MPASKQPAQIGACNTLILKSGADVFPACVDWECWLRRGGFSERIKLTISIEPRPHHHFELVYRVRIENRGRPPKERLYGRLNDATLQALVGTLLDSPSVRVPSLSEPRLRLRPFELLASAQPPRVSLRSDLLGRLAWLVLVVGIAFGLLVEPGGSLIELIWRLREGLRQVLLEIFGWGFVDGLDTMWLIAPALLAGSVYLRARRGSGRFALVVLAAAGLLVFAFQPSGLLIEWWWSLHVAALEAVGPVLNAIGGMGWTGVLLLAAAIVGFAVLRSRQTYLVYNEGRPLTEPRVLTLGDYWHTVLPEIGGEADAARERFLARVREILHPELHAWVERVATRGVDGKEEREQVVLSCRRALVFCQFHAYGRDLYVGWDAFLNRGRWVERRLARGVERKTRDRVVINVVEPGQDVLTEYDLIDLNCAIEWAHGRMVELVKQVAAEHAIDQEIDFTIQRADRAGLVGAGREGDEEKTGAGRAVARGITRLRRAG